MTNLERALLRIRSDLEQIGVPFALVGGLAVSLRAEPRTTRDVDLAVAVDGDERAEAVVHGLMARGYHVMSQVEQDRTGRLASVRIVLPGEPLGGVVVDLLFASSGIEREVVDRAEMLEVLPGVRIKVATTPDLVALKVLAGRAKDRTDLAALLPELDAAGHDHVRASLELISRRGFDRHKDLLREYDRVIARLHRDSGDDEG